MDYLHAYWRMEYIEAPRRSWRKPFTELPALGDDEAAAIVHRSLHSYLMLNIFPYNAGHLLAIPYREVPDWDDLTPEERADLWAEIRYAKQLLNAALKPDGFNVGFNLGSAAGGSLAEHLHAHIVPRWNGDNNFMPVIGGVKVLPQAMSLMWKRLVDVAANTPRAAD
jgi:ATP adenylyltransferase